MASWKLSALVGAFAMMGLVACGGDTTDDADMGDMDMPEPPAAETPAPGAETPAAVDLPEGVTQEMVAQGEQVFTGRAGGGTCHVCHAMDATGTPLAPDLTDDAWLNISGRDYDEIVQVVTNGVPEPVEAQAGMPPMGGASLSEENIRAVAAYVMTLGQD